MELYYVCLNGNRTSRGKFRRQRKTYCYHHQLFTYTPPAPKTAIQIKKLDYCHHPQIDFCCLGFLDVSNWILILSSFITRDICRVSLVVLLLRSTTWLFFHTHSHTHKIQNVFLILWQIVSNSFVLHDRQQLFRQALCDILPVRKRLEWQCWSPFQQQFLCRYCIVRGAGSVQFRTAL